jgi:PQQ-like domain
MPHDCPRCGAPLPPPKGAHVVCKYCHNNVNLDLKRQPHPAKRSPYRFAWLKAELWWTVVVVMAVGGWQVARLVTHISQGPVAVPVPVPTDTFRTAATSSAEEPRLTERVTVEGKLLLINALDDAHQDCLAVARFSANSSERWLLAMSGKDGHVLWRHPLPGTAASEEPELTFSDRSVVVRTSEQLIHLDAVTGALNWQAASKTSTGRLCATSAYLAIKATAPITEAWDWKSGRELQVKAGRCEPLYSTQDAGPNFQYLEPSASGAIVSPPKGLTLLRVLMPHQGNARVVLGVQNEAGVNRGSPQVGVVANRRWVWKQDLSEYTFATLPAPPLAAVRRESVVVPYWDSQNKALRLAAFGLERGKRLWDIAINESVALPSKTDLDVAITLDGAVLTRTIDGQLRAYALDTGAPMWSIGGT